MSNLVSVLKAEIQRLAKKEAKAQISGLKSASSQHRRDIAALKRKIKEQDRTIASLKKQSSRAQRESAPAEEAPSIRFSPDWVAKHREKLGLSAADYAALVGVSHLTIYNWEKGKTRPQQKQLESWAAVRKLGKREAWQKLDEM